ncbi:hypothetical protein Bhyg_10962 [Pseudolycoriella hygida]|uniref:Uncharacterized protein n=1 Tax=Pseudolycoriella hygida TaxID=35572 RepID=A0A9Q0MW39_9DIPT|nr:hypothetical protein Bhyg_10962 [Pseudolycoriella hygida]
MMYYDQNGVFNNQRKDLTSKSL